jgi:hypothetical protein
MVAKRCPRCHRANAGSTWRCGCSREPGLGVELVRAVLRDRQASAWITLVLLLALDAATVSGVVYAALQGFIVVSALGFTALILLTARAVQRVRVTRARLRQLARLNTVLPRAVVHRR